MCACGNGCTLTDIGSRSLSHSSFMNQFWGFGETERESENVNEKRRRGGGQESQFGEDISCEDTLAAFGSWTRDREQWKTGDFLRLKERVALNAGRKLFVACWRLITSG